jgi:hypothetical protein
VDHCACFFKEGYGGLGFEWEKSTRKKSPALRKLVICVWSKIIVGICVTENNKAKFSNNLNLLVGNNVEYVINIVFRSDDFFSITKTGRITPVP